MNYEDIWLTSSKGKIFARVWSNPLTSQNPIVLFHDSLGSVDLWRNFPELLSEATQRTVITYDRPGFGKSCEVHQSQSTQFIADEAVNAFADVRRQLGLQRFVALGHSVSGGMAIHCAAHYQSNCEAVITLAAQSFVEDRTLEGIRVAQQLFKDPRQVERLKKYHGNKTQWVLDAWINTWLADAFSDWSLKTILPQVKTKLLAIHGINDEYGTTEHPQQIVDFTGGPSRMILMENTAHFPHREHPQQVIDAVKEFLVKA